MPIILTYFNTNEKITQQNKHEFLKIIFKFLFLCRLYRIDLRTNFKNNMIEKILFVL